MKEFISRNRRWLGYVFFCIIVTAGLLYYRFPSDALTDYLQARANTVNSQLSLSIDRIKPWLPLGLKLERTELSLKDKPTAKLFRADSLFVRPDVWSFFKGKSKYCFECLAYGGDVRGYVYFKKNSMEAPFDTEIELKNIQIAKYEHLKDLIGRQVDGILCGTIFYKGQHKNLMDGTGEANLKLLDGNVELMVPILSLESIEFHEIKSDIVLKKQKISLKRFELTGPLLKSTLSGTIRLKKRFADSTLDLRGTIEPLASFFKNTEGAYTALRFLKKRLRKGTLTFIIRGTLGEPKIKFT